MGFVPTPEAIAPSVPAGLADRASLWSSIVDAAPFGILLSDRDGKILFANRQAGRLLGYRHDELPGMSVDLLVPVAARARHGDERAQYYAKPRTHVMGQGRDLIALRKDGSTVPVEIALSVVSDESGFVVIASIADITERKRAEAEIQHISTELQDANRHLSRLATTDSLTGLLNRRGLDEAVARVIAGSRRSGAHMSAILIDCDNFKTVNDRLGHAAGDKTLRTIAGLLGGAVRPTDHTARIGGDEFMVVAPGTALDEGCLFADRLRETLNDGLEALRLDLSVSVSAGVAEVPPQATVDSLILATQAALKRAKRSGKNRIAAIGDAKEGPDAPSEIDDLLAGVGLYAAGQEIIDLESDKSVGFELYTRWSGRLEMPNDFFRLAPDRESRARLDLRCLDACLEAASLIAPEKSVHVNLFPATLLAVPFLDLCAALARCRPMGTLCLELSATSFAGRASDAVPLIRELKRRGVQVALDDVGPAALEQVVLLNPDVVKTDPHFTRGLAQDEGARRAFERLVRVLHSLGSEIIAEGIEERADLDVVRGCGIKLGQGYFWGRPLAR